MNLNETISSKELYESLLNLCLDNKQFFHNLNDTKSQKLYNAFVSLEEQIENILPLLHDFRAIAPAYDFKSVRENGYRSFVTIVDKLSCITIKICQHVCDYRNSLFFQRLHYVKLVYIFLIYYCFLLKSSE